MRWRTSSLGCLCLPPRASGGVASGSRRTNVEPRLGHHPHATSATTREDWRSSARDAPSRAESPRKDMVVWPVQEPVVEMVLSLSGARLKMTVLGLLEAAHTCGLASLATLPSDVGSMHETHSDAVSMMMSSSTAGSHWMVCEVGCLDVGSASQYAQYTACSRAFSTTPDNCRGSLWHMVWTHARTLISPAACQVSKAMPSEGWNRG